MSVGAVRGAEALEDGHVFTEDEVWYLADAIPMGGTAGVALLEHRWAIPLRDAIEEAGGAVLADEWVHPADLIAIGHAATHIDGEGSAGGSAVPTDHPEGVKIATLDRRTIHTD